MFAAAYNMENVLGKLFIAFSPVQFYELLLTIMQQHNLARYFKEVFFAGHPLSNLNKRIKGVIDTN